MSIVKQVQTHNSLHCKTCLNTQFISFYCKFSFHFTSNILEYEKSIYILMYCTWIFIIPPARRIHIRGDQIYSHFYVLYLDFQNTACSAYSYSRRSAAIFISSCSFSAINSFSCISCLCMYVCMYVCVYMYVCMCVCVCVCVCVCMDVCMYVCMYVCVHVCMKTNVS